MTSFDLKNNRIDLIRLLAATQVAALHFIQFFEIPVSPWLYSLIRQIPGVPVFFCLSGFLIYQSYQKSTTNLSYGFNRVLRLYPALIVCLFVSVLLVLHSGYQLPESFTWRAGLAWIGAQLTFAQFFNPGFLRGYGVGTLNGSLWTISVEIQFYLLVPIVWWVVSKSQIHRLSLFGATLVFVLINIWFGWSVTGDTAPGLVNKLVGVSFLPWFYMFLVGAWLSSRADVIQWLVMQRWWLTGAFVVYAFVAFLFDWPTGNRLNPVAYLLLAGLVIAWAFPARSESGTASKFTALRNDFSYGIYIYHMPVINYFLVTREESTAGVVVIAIALTALLAVISWYWIERPALRLKRQTLFAR